MDQVPNPNPPFPVADAEPLLPPRRITVGLFGLIFSCVAVMSLGMMFLLRPG